MALRVDSEEADRLARQLSAITGESLTVAVTLALRERLERVNRPQDPARREALRAIRQRAAQLPQLDRRSDAEILGQDESGRGISRW
ncbi:type II toxin-antitoxin system VapB family antitoxin [Azospirillum sp.]|uniref:type II toxin-antitoxin system VapB family antitoxin n=1 Tax=Azospirillum sp. TaxID=34012 RepID=UPI0026319F82|nr:type II toxin-antitoxin system VapB family antitoxin [Azospirillum sp.]